MHGLNNLIIYVFPLFDQLQLGYGGIQVISKNRVCKVNVVAEVPKVVFYAPSN